MKHLDFTRFWVNSTVFDKSFECDRNIHEEEYNVEFEKVKEIIVDSLSCDEDAVTLEANLKEDLDADSLDAVELIMAVEEEFDIEIPDDKAAEIKTVQDIVDYIKENA